MKKYIVFPLLAYIIVCVIGVIMSASKGYNVIRGKLFIGKIYAIPVIVAASISYYFYKQGVKEKIYGIV